MAVCFNYFLSTVIFVNIDISQGSIATYSRCGAIIKYEFAANLLLSLKIVAFQEVIDNSLMSCFFDSRCIADRFSGPGRADDTACVFVRQ